MNKLFCNSNHLVLKNRAKQTSVSIFRFLFIFGLCYLFLFPILYMCITAFQSVASAEDPTVVWIPKGFSLDGITKAIEELDYIKSAILTLTITIGSTIFSLISCSLAGYGLARFKFPFKALTMIILVLTIIIPPQILYTSNYLLFRFFDFGGVTSLFNVSFNLLESPMVFILPSMFAAGLRNGIFIFIFYSTFKGLPYEMEEAAKIDGCGVFKTFVQVMLPLAVPAFVTVLLFSIVWHWTDFHSSSTYFTQAIRPIVVMLKSLNDSLEFGLLASNGSKFEIRMYVQAGAMLTIAPPLILYIFTQKYFTESIERTGLVG